MREELSGLCAKTIVFEEDLLRNIKSIRESQNLFDDLANDDFDRSTAVAATALARIESPAPFITRPFDYGAVISYTFDASHWQETRFSDGQHYGVWYGGLDLETTVFETVFHWRRFLQDSYADYEQEIVGERRVFRVACHALLIDLRNKERDFPELLSRRSYGFCQRLGAWLVEQGQNGVLVKSARYEGVNGAIFRPERLSNVRDICYLTYRTVPSQDWATVERKPGQTWLRIRPSDLA